MTALDKLVRRMRNNPRDWRIEDIEKVAEHYGFRCRKTSGSHVTFSHAALEDILTVPAHKPVKPVYVRKLLTMMDEVGE